VQPLGSNQTSHYALIRAMDDGSTRIDRYHRLTGDKTWHQGHWFSPRAPGLGLFELPVYEGFEALGVSPRYRVRLGGENRSETIWLLGIWGAVIPAVAMMLLVRSVAERVEPGYGTLAAVTLGLGTIVLPFATVLFSHLLSACLAFAAFALLFRERDGPPRSRLWPFALAGLCTGYAITTEYALALVALVLGVYAVSTEDRVRRGLAYLGGCAAGVIPLAVYNQLAFGSISHVGYADVPHQRSGFFGIHVPSPRVVVELLLSSHGLLVLSPVVGMGAVGTVLLHRRGYRREAAVVTAVGIGFLAYSAGYFLPFGGAVPSSRFLIATLPFLCFPLALTYRRWPGPTVALAAASIVTIGVATITRPLPGGGTDLRIWTDLLEGGHPTSTFLSLLKVHGGWVGLVPTLAVALLAVALAVRSAPLVLAWWSAAVGASIVAAWAAFAALGPNRLGIDRAAAKVLTADDPAARVEGLGHDPLVHLVLMAVAGCLAALLVVRLVSISRGRRDGARAPTSRGRSDERRPHPVGEIAPL
jgi:hypothetical protein